METVATKLLQRALLHSGIEAVVFDLHVKVVFRVVGKHGQQVTKRHEPVAAAYWVMRYYELPVPCQAYVTLHAVDG
ncbi:hypothetical protein GCM10009537_08470 [Corynebacterium riegelii]